MTILIEGGGGGIGTEEDSNNVRLHGGSAIVFVRGDVFDGATVVIEAASANDADIRFEVLENGTFVGNGTVKIDYSASALIIRARLLTTGALTSNIYVELVQ